MVLNWDDLPPALKPHYEAEEPNQPILLYEGDLQIGTAEAEVVGSGKIHFKWFPYPQAEFNASVSELPRPDVVEAFLKLPGVENSVRVFIASTNHSDSATGTSMQIIGRLRERMEMGSSHCLSYVQFHLTNFTRFIGNGIAVIEDGEAKFAAQRITFEQDSWRITIDEFQTTTSRLKSVESQGGYVIAHVGKLEKLDGTTFAAEEARQFLECFDYFLSFLQGFRTSPLLLVGYDSMDLPVWKESNVSNAAPWRSVFTWSYGLISRDIATVVPGFFRWWKDWGDSARIVIHWYLESFQSGTVEGACILETAALELLAWVKFEDEFRDDLSRKQKKFGYASQKLNHLLASSGIPQTIPIELNDMTSLATRQKWMNGAQTFCAIRNNITHAAPENRERLTDISVAARVEARQLGLWYVELILLRLFNYEGRYFNRLPKGIRYIGDLEPVPWCRDRSD
jgi:hypothetical protein